MEEFSPLMMLGVRVREVQRLEEESLWLPRRKLLIVDESLSPFQREEVAAHFLPQVLERESGVSA